jgi:hypothetical protein
VSPHQRVGVALVELIQHGGAYDQRVPATAWTMSGTSALGGPPGMPAALVATTRKLRRGFVSAK